jgi:hypothetical protein
MMGADVGRGIYAGRAFAKKELISTDPSITVPTSLAMEIGLVYYVYSSADSNYSMLNLGVSALMNDCQPQSVDNRWSKFGSLEIDKTGSPFTTYSDVSEVAIQDIRAGEELCTSYGDNDWFISRGVFKATVSPDSDAQHRSQSVSDIEERGHCLTDVEVKPSLIGGAGRGLFATRSFAAGEVVSISPALILPKHIIGSPNADTVMLNYAFSVSGSDVALLPLGLGAMSNHGGSESNMAVDWFDWSSGSSGVIPSAVSDYSVYELESRKFAPVDIAYVARRAISAGEELTIDYGSEWNKAWEIYLSSVALNYKSSDSKTDFISISPDGESNSPDITAKPIRFVNAIGAPEGLFPSSWNVDCIGDKLCDYSSTRQEDINVSGCGLYLADSTIPGNFTSSLFCFHYVHEVFNCV